MRRQQNISGFTLIEMILVIVLLGIISAVLAPVITSNVTAYHDTRTRSDLVARGRVALERLTREIHLAIPNSLRLVSGTTNTIEFVTISTGGRYVDRDDTLITAGSCPTARRFRIGFSLSQLCLLHPNAAGNPPFAANDILVIGNTSPGSLENGNTRVQITAVTQATPIWTASFNNFTFNDASPGKHYSIVDSSHEVGLVNGSLRWRRSTGIQAAEYDDGIDVSGADALLIDNVGSIQFRYDAAADGILKVELTLTDGDESVELFEEIYVRNTP